MIKSRHSAWPQPHSAPDTTPHTLCDDRQGTLSQIYQHSPHVSCSMCLESICTSPHRLHGSSSQENSRRTKEIEAAVGAAAAVAAEAVRSAC